MNKILFYKLSKKNFKKFKKFLVNIDLMKKKIIKIFNNYFEEN